MKARYEIGVALVLTMGAAASADAIPPPPAPASGYYATGATLLDYAATDARVSADAMNAARLGIRKQAEYYGYVMGVEDTLNGKAFCLPTNVPQIDTIDIVTIYAKAHPETAKQPAAALIRAALADEYPCN